MNTQQEWNNVIPKLHGFHLLQQFRNKWNETDEAEFRGAYFAAVTVFAYIHAVPQNKVISALVNEYYKEGGLP